MSEARSLYEADFVRWSEEQAAVIRLAAASRTKMDDTSAALRFTDREVTGPFLPEPRR